MQEVTFGFVVPVYKTKPEYLYECVDSIRNQSYQNLKIVLVDDASPDNCGKLCDEIAAQDPRITVCHHPVNKGVSEARNTGTDKLEELGCDWVSFVDSDDWVEAEMCRELNTAIQKHPADILICSGFRNVGDEEIRCDFHFDHEKVFATYDEREQLQLQLVYDQTKGCPVNKYPIQQPGNRVYTMKLLSEHKVRYLPLKFYEDGLMHLYSLEKAGKAVYLQQRFYHYRDTPGSAVNSFRPNADVEQLSVMDELWKFMDLFDKKEHFRQLMYMISFMSMQMCVFQKYYSDGYHVPKKQRRKECAELFAKEPYASTLENIKNLPLNRLRTNQIIKYYLMRAKLYGFMTYLRKVSVKG